MAQGTVLIVPCEPLVEAMRVESMRAAEAPNLRIFGEIVKTDGAVLQSVQSTRRIGLVSHTYHRGSDACDKSEDFSF